MSEPNTAAGSGSGRDNGDHHHGNGHGDVQNLPPSLVTSRNPSVSNDQNPHDTTARSVRFSDEIERTEQSNSPNSQLSPTLRSPRRSIRNSYFGLARIPSSSVVETINHPGDHSAFPTSPTSRFREDSLRTGIFRRNADEMFSTSPADKKSGNVEINTPDNTDSRNSSTKEPITSSLPYFQNWLESRPKKSEFSKRWKALTTRASNFALGIQQLPPTKYGRQIILDASRTEPLIDERRNRPYVENWIRSTRYTAYTFLPRQLFAQFSKLANFYFLCVAILQMIPNFSTTGQYTTIAPLLFFVSISMLKEGFDDYRRYRLDQEENRKEAVILDPSSGQNYGSLSWIKVPWRSLKVGNMIKLKRDEPVPADIVLLRSENENQVAFVETMALDGETNLKSKITTAFVAKACDTDQKLQDCRAHFVVEDPNPNLYSFEGKVTIDQESAPLSNSEVIYRGSIIRNTPELIGMIIYTGEECKIRMNANKNPRTKAPQLQTQLNRIVAIVVVFVIALCLFNSISYIVWRRKDERRAWYLVSVPIHEIVSGFFIMFSTMIPLSLYISMEIIKLAQMYLLNDIDMYDKKSNTPFEARTSTINEELGQITHIFTDKTGTLTDNEMKFRKISVAGTVWFHDYDLQGPKETLMRHKKRNKGKKTTRRLSASSRRKSSVIQIEKAVSLTQEPQEDKNLSIPRTAELIRYLQRFPDTIFSQKVRLFLLSIALCHTCLPETKDDGSIAFQAASPDELALVQAAQELGYLAYNREHATLCLKIYPGGDMTAEPTIEKYQILDVIEFSSRRKRMSVVVRFPDGRVCVICKGADTIVMQRLKLADLAIEKINEVEQRVERRKSVEAQVALARRGSQLERSKSLRRSSLAMDVQAPTRSMSVVSENEARMEVDSWLRSRETDVELVGEEDTRRMSQIGRGMSIAASEILEEDFEDYIDNVDAASDALTIERCFQHINDFATEGLRTLLYAYRFLDEDEYVKWKETYHAATTAFSQREEKIESAGELIEVDFDLAGATAIEDKLQHGVPESMDKLRRANIKIWMLTGDKRETAINIGHSCRLIKDYSLTIILDKNADDVEQTIGAATLELQKRKVAHSVVVVDGQTLTWIEEAEHRQFLFYELAVLADSVICCRAQPSQKAELVHGMKKRVRDSITLAIGDGANDIAMIQEAHVGIGITGKEGLQAARTSDYSIAQFRFLNKLLLVHGRWNYVRTCKYILGTLWKEMVFFITQAMFQRYCGYSGTSLYEPWSLATFNTLFTSLPVLIMGIFEKDLAASTLLAAPELYSIGQKDEVFNFLTFVWWTLMSVAESAIIFYSMYGLYGLTNEHTIFPLGDLTFAACVFVITIKMQLVEMHNKSIACFLAFGISIAAIFLWNILLALIYPKTSMYRVRGGMWHGWGVDPRWWTTLFYAVAGVVVLEMGVRAARNAIKPSETKIFQMLEKDPIIRQRFEEASAMELHQGWEAAAEALKQKEDKKNKSPKAKSNAELELAELRSQRRNTGEFEEVAVPSQPSQEDAARRDATIV